ncbi:MAG: TetR/AcrR family transcriptional regulator [Actinomycetota bacterium]|jgi:TetR/AcrR family transcriptional regulator, lmrAB and yxaGH operons repressor|nr:TetR/AcrR family transcriptional regulator [Actinomycetota bacterium]
MVRRDVRRLAIEAAARLFGTDGYHGTGLTKILDESGAPKGSFYFHFPEGKEQLAEEAIAAASAQMEEFIFFSIEQANQGRGSAIEHLARALQRRLIDSDFAMGGPITSLTLETAHLNERLRAASAAAYARWVGLLAEHFGNQGTEQTEAEETATLVLAALEGSLALAKAQRDPDLVVRSTSRLSRLLT